MRIINVPNSEITVDAQELTERFVRGDSSRHTEGSGLGLSITKILAELQDAELEVEVDDENKFIATLIFDVAEEKNEPKKKKPHIGGKNK